MDVKDKTSEFYELVSLKGDYNYTGEEKLSERRYHYVTSDMLMAGISFSQGYTPEISLTDIQVGYLIGKVGTMNTAEIINAMKLRVEKLENSALPTTPTLTNTTSILARLVNRGIICRMAISGTKAQVFYTITNQGRLFVNKVNNNKLKDLEYESIPNEREVLGDAAVSYVLLKFMKYGYEINQNRIVKLKIGTERFGGIINKDDTTIAIESLYFWHDKTLASSKENIEGQKNKIKKICDFLYKEKRKVILLCNSMKDIQIFFNIFLSEYCSDKNSDICERMYFSSIECIKAKTDVKKAIARFNVEYHEGMWCVNGNCIFDFLT